MNLHQQKKELYAYAVKFMKGDTYRNDSTTKHTLSVVGRNRERLT